MAKRLYFQVNRREYFAGPEKYLHKRNETAGFLRQTEAGVYNRVKAPGLWRRAEEKTMHRSR